MSVVESKVPMGQKIAFGVGMLANQMFPAVLGIFMVVLVQDLGFSGAQWGLLFFLPRIFDSITDPIMGFISDNTRSKWGRRRQYVFIGAIIMGISFAIMWQLYRANSVEYNFYYFLLWSFVFYLGLTIFSVPYVAMGYEMSNDFHERTNIMAIAQWIGQWAWVIAPWFWVIMYDPSWFESADVATRTLGVLVAIVCMIFAMVPAIFIKSKSTVNEDYAPLTFSNIGGSLSEIFDGFIQAFSSKPFRKLCIATFFIFNAFNTIASFSFFIIVYHLFKGDAGAAGIWPTLFGSIGALITTFLVIPTVAKMSKMIGKKRAFILSQGISIFGYILLWFLFIPGKPYMFLFALPFFSFGIGGLFTLMMSMTADVIDLDELKTGKRREGIFGAIYWWMVKFGFAIAGGLSGAIMASVGFEANPETFTQTSVDGLRMFFSGFPVLGTLIAMFVMRDYGVSEERAREIRTELDSRKANSEGGSSYYKEGMLASLGTGIGKIDSTKEIDFTKMSDVQLKATFANSLNTGMTGVCFSPYMDGQNIGDQLSKEQIIRRMSLIAPYTKWVRSFSCTEGNELIPEIAKIQDLNTMVGAWIGKDKTKNEVEIANLIKLAKAGHVDIAVVGNEVFMREELSEAEVIMYINKVKKALPNIKVGYVDAYYQFYKRPKLVDACDVVLANCYPFWEGVSIEESFHSLKQMYAIAEKAANGKKVIITETGWPSKGADVSSAIPSESNAMKYFVNATNWSQEKADLSIFYFSSFDESWKVHQEGDVGARWGIWDKSEKLKY